ncbi:hypothetical protein DSM100688_1879 [Bifidobacterium ramosum]|uniref:Uncharacterized protein n=1 Tax=Bifidobacterium ramosum TaxID=1798158 RepID=A0A6L4WZD9_9BIFI|nr:hypothetical protein [Bifidobacterium ramosum]KAB8287104.1 hypothetical protein DSM100688_1879 [Bifidobacterium ramosum]NEG71833.1 hypothetical protein [Bifidobacterium ramosum]
MSRKYLDEFFGEIRVRSTKEVRKPRLRFGNLAAAFIMQCVAKKFKQYQSTLPDNAPQTAQDCANQFFKDRLVSLTNAMRGPKMADDVAFERYIRSSVNGWFLNLYRATEEGRERDALRNRMKRDKKKRFVNMGGNRWGLTDDIDSIHIASSVPEQELYTVADSCPLDFNAKALLDESRKRMPNYGKTGQMENLLEAVLKEARGTLELSVLRRIVVHRISMLEKTLVQSIDAGGEPIDLPVDDQSVEEQALSQYSDIPDDDAKRIVEEMKRRGSEWTRDYIRQHPGVAEMLTSRLENDPHDREELS